MSEFGLPWYVYDRITIEPDGCWVYKERRSGGYSAYWNRGQRTTVMRLMYELLVESAAGRVLHHECRRKWCVNPGHLRAITASEHSRLHPETTSGALTASARSRRGRTHCKRGHEFTPSNTHTTKVGTRQCRSCMAMHQRAYRARALA